MQTTELRAVAYISIVSSFLTVRHSFDLFITTFLCRCSFPTAGLDTHTGVHQQKRYDHNRHGATVEDMDHEFVVVNETVSSLCLLNCTHDISHYDTNTGNHLDCNMPLPFNLGRDVCWQLLQPRVDSQSVEDVEAEDENLQ